MRMLLSSSLTVPDVQFSRFRFFMEELCSRRCSDGQSGLPAEGDAVGDLDRQRPIHEPARFELYPTSPIRSDWRVEWYWQGDNRGRTTMRTRYAVALSMLAGIVIGGTAIQTLHAQAKPPVYLIAQNEVTNPEAYLKVSLAERLRR